MQAAGARMFHQPDLETKIKTYFYNELVNYVLNLGEYDANDLDEKIFAGIVAIIRATIKASQKQEATVLPDDQGAAVLRITTESCPGRYLVFHWTLSSLKQKPNLDEREIIGLAEQLTHLESFREMNPKQQLLSMANPAAPQQPIHYEENGVTAELIRKSFYNEMLTQALHAVEKGWISRMDLEDEDVNIYFSLPSVTIIGAIEQSHLCSNGIRLLGYKAVNANNCPREDQFPELIAAILLAKQKVAALSEPAVKTLKHLLATEQPLPEELLPHKTSDLMETVSVIKGMSMEISRRHMFQQMIGLVRERLLEIIPPAEIEQAGPRI